MQLLPPKPNQQIPPKPVLGPPNTLHPCEAALGQHKLLNPSTVIVHPNPPPVVVFGRLTHLQHAHPFGLPKQPTHALQAAFRPALDHHPLEDAERGGHVEALIRCAAQVLVSVGDLVGGQVAAKVGAEQSGYADVIGGDVHALGREARFRHAVAEEPGVAADVQVGCVRLRQALVRADGQHEVQPPLAVVPVDLPFAAFGQFDGLVRCLGAGEGLPLTEAIDDLRFGQRLEALEARLADRLSSILMVVDEEVAGLPPFASLTGQRQAGGPVPLADWRTVRRVHHQAQSESFLRGSARAASRTALASPVSPATSPAT